MPWDRDEELEDETVQRAEQVAADLTRTATAPTATPGVPTDLKTAQTYIQQEYQIVTEAQRRLAKAQLYQALLNQSIFGQSASSPEIVEEVSNELRSFALERLEVMLGMRTPTATPAGAVCSFTPEEVAQIRAVLTQFAEGTVPVLGAEEATALRLLLSKITCKAPSLPQKFTAAVQPIQVPTATPINTVVTQTPVMLPPQRPQAPAQPKPRGRRKGSDNPNKKAMPTVDMMNSKIAEEAAAAASANPAAPSILGLAIQTALKNSGEE